MARPRTPSGSPQRRHGSTDVDDARTPPFEAIQASAFELFARRGYLVSTVREVMQACGLTQGALYNHFPSKDHLLATLIKATQDGLERECRDAVAAVGSHPGAQLRAFVSTFTIRHCKRRTEALVANRDFEWLKPESLQEIVASRRRIRDALVEILRAGVQTGAFHLPKAGTRADERIVAMAILNQCIYVSSWYKPGGGWEENDVAELHAQMALRIVGSEGPQST